MKKILFISTRNPYSNRYSGDIIGSKKIINLLKKSNLLDVVSLGKKKDFSKKNIFIFKRPIFFSKFLHALKSLIIFKPMQLGFFYSDEMKTFINNNAMNYDIIFFYHIRSSQYLPENYHGKKIIEMGDLYSNNYHQTFRNLNILNPIKYIYFFESLLVKQLEKKIFTNFDNIILFSKNEIKKIERVFSKKITHLNISIDKIKKKYQFSKKNNKILFIGNLKYLPNILAVKKFAKDILPELTKKKSDIKFEIIGEINNFDKFLLSKNKNIKCWGAQKNLDKFIEGSFCGLANLEIATGVQGKILTYMSYGLPVICSKRVASNFLKNVISYNDDGDLINKIRKLKYDRKFSNYISKKSYNFVKKFDWKKVSKDYLKIIKN